MSSQSGTEWLEIIKSFQSHRAFLNIKLETARRWVIFRAFTCKNLVFLKYDHQGNKKSDAEVVLPQTPLGVVADVKNT